ncbi:MAG: GntR family transcriptional regulator [Eubacteriales bacterium]
MVSFHDLILKEDSPIYLQIIAHVKAGIVGELIKNGDEMPSRRTVSALLGVNPNTIQKAYRQMEEEGLIYSHAGAKSSITVSQAQVKELKKELLEGDILHIILRLQAIGLKKEDAFTLLEDLWEENEDETKI